MWVLIPASLALGAAAGLGAFCGHLAGWLAAALWRRVRP